MKLYSSDAGEMMEIERLEVKDGVLIIHGQIFGTMPMAAQLRQHDVRRGLKLLNFRCMAYLLRALLWPSRRDA